MNKNKRYLTAVMLLAGLLISMLHGCYTPAGRSAGEVIDDSTITTKVKAKLFDAEELSGFAISVDTFEGTVTLTGAVERHEQKEQTGTIAGSVRGVRGVNNLLKIKSSP